MFRWKAECFLCPLQELDASPPLGFIFWLMCLEKNGSMSRSSKKKSWEFNRISMLSMVDNNQMIVVNVIIWSINVNLVDYVITMLINVNLQSWLGIQFWISMVNAQCLGNTYGSYEEICVFFNDHPMCKWGTSWGTSVNNRVINHVFMACFMVPWW